jgi:SulP family sulfate permease
MVIYESTRPNFTVLGRIPGTIYYRNAKRFENILDRKDILVMRFDSHLFFANAAHFRARMEEEIKRKGDDLRLIIINADAISNLDSTGLNMLKDLIKDLHTQELKVYFSGVTGPVRDAMYKAELKQWMGSECFYLAVQEAVDAFDKGESSDFNEYTMQANT